MKKYDDGSIAALEKNICPACGKEFETGNIIMTKDLNKRFQDKYILTGLSLCEDCMKMAEEKDCIWFCEVIQIDDGCATRRSFLMKKHLIENETETLKVHAEKNRWVAIGIEDADILSTIMNGDKNGKE